MKPLVVAILLLGSLVSSAEDMQAYLRQTQNLVRQGQHQEALERMIWFHDNALKQDPTMYATRLTLALDEWSSLAEFYKPAKQALVAIRDRNEERLLGRGGSRQVFNDLVAINRVLGEPERSLTVFREIHDNRPKQARQYWPLIKEEVLEQQELQLASQYISDPMAEFRSLKKTYQRLAKNSLKSSEPQSQIARAREQQFVADTRPLVELAVITGDKQNAVRIQEEALELLRDPELKEELTAGLPEIPEALPPAEDPPAPEE